MKQQQEKEMSGASQNILCHSEVDMYHVPDLCFY